MSLKDTIKFFTKLRYRISKKGDNYTSKYRQFWNPFWTEIATVDTLEEASKSLFAFMKVEENLPRIIYDCCPFTEDDMTIIYAVLDYTIEKNKEHASKDLDYQDIVKIRDKIKSKIEKEETGEQDEH